MRLVRAAMTALFCGLTLAGVVGAEEPTEKEQADGMDFAMHDAAYTMYHEIGHTLVGEFELPVLGKEEDAADALAVIMLLNDDEDEVEASNTLIDSSDGWYFNAVKANRSSVEDLSYYDEHSLDIQRAYAMVCMMVGDKPEVFKETADNYELDQDRQDGCAETYQQAFNSWTKLLEPHVVGATPGAKINVVYDDAGEFENYADELKSRQVLEKAAALVTSQYALPREITFRGTLCGEANAYYSASTAEVVYCYELAADMYGLYVNDILHQDDAAEDGTATEDEVEAEAEAE